MTEMTHDDSSRALLPRLVAAVEHLGLCRHTGAFEELRQVRTATGDWRGRRTRKDVGVGDWRPGVGLGSQGLD